MSKPLMAFLGLGKPAAAKKNADEKPGETNVKADADTDGFRAVAPPVLSFASGRRR